MPPTYLNGTVTFNGNALFGSAYPYADVQAHGAVGDGTTDDTTAFQNAITSAGTRGTVAVPFTTAGYKITGTLNIHQVNFIGLNGRAILKPSGTLANLFSIGDPTIAGTVEGVRLANIQVLLDNAPTGMAVVKGVRGFSNWTVENFDITRAVRITRAQIIAAANAGFNLQIDPNNPDFHSYNLFMNLRMQFVHPAFDGDWSSYTAQKGTNLFSSNVFIDTFISRCYSGFKIVGIGNHFVMGDFGVIVRDFVGGTDYLMQVKGAENWLGVGFDGGTTAPAPFGQSMVGNIWTGYNLGLSYSNGKRAVQTIDVNGNILAGQSTQATIVTQQQGWTGVISPALSYQAVAESAGSGVTPDLNVASLYEIDVSDATAFTIANPLNVQQNQLLIIRIFGNASAVGTVTWGTAYKFPGGVSPTMPTANGQFTHCVFLADGSGNMWLVAPATTPSATAQTGTANRFRMLQSMARIDQTNINQSLASGAGGAVIAFTSGATATVNTDSMWASTTPTRLTAQVTGKYNLKAVVAFPSQANGTGIAFLTFRKNGTTTIGQGVQLPYVSGQSSISLSYADGVFPLTGGDYVEIVGGQTSGATQMINTGSFAMIYQGE